MQENNRHYVLTERAMPEVLLKVMEAKHLLESGNALSIQEATEKVGISRSSFYKYKDEVFAYHKREQGKITTVVIQLNDSPGMFLDVLKTIATYGINVRAIQQSMSINGVASFMLNLETMGNDENIPAIVEEIGKQAGIHYIKVIAKE